MSTTLLDVEAVRRRYSSLQGDFVFLDAPGGSQVPDEVGDAIARTLREASANVGAPYETSYRVGAILESARETAGRFLGCSADEVVFGTNMTTVNFMLSRTASREWRERDEVVVTRLDHDGNVAPWLELAHDKGLVVRLCDVTAEGRLDLDDLARLLGDRTRVVAFPCASNAIGTIAEIRRVADMAREAGAISWADAVHYAAHEPIDVAALGVDVLLCSPYKFCGPHLGLAYARRELAETWRPYKARPAPSSPVGRSFETGTAPYELLAGFEATVAYLDSIGGLPAIREYERALGERMLDGFSDRVTVYGLADDGGPRADVPDQRRRRGRAGGGRPAVRAGLRRLGARQLLLARPARAARLGRGGAGRADPLQHRRRGRPLPRGVARALGHGHRSPRARVDLGDRQRRGRDRALRLGGAARRRRGPRGAAAARHPPAHAARTLMARRTVDELLADARDRIDRLEPDEALAAAKAGALIVDTRSNEARARDGIIPGSLHLPRSVLEWRVDPSSPWRNEHVGGLDRRIVLVCEHGYSSSLAAATLVELGFERACDVVGGFEAWKAAGLPVVDAPPAPDDGRLPGMEPPAA